MVIIENKDNETINFVDDRSPSGGAVTLQLTHIASGEYLIYSGVTVTDGSFLIDASDLRNGLHSAIITEGLEGITSFILKVQDVNPIILPENNNEIILGYLNN